jgi:hypothetical protein
MTTSRLAALAALATLALTGCNKRDHEPPAFAGGAAHAAEPAAIVADAPADDGGSGGLGGGEAAKPADPRKIIRTGRLALTVETYDEARAGIEALVAEAGGFVDSTRVTHHEGVVGRATIVVRIPAAGFGAILPRLRALGRVEAESTDASDVTGQYVDVAARLASARTLEHRLLELVAARAGTIGEVLEVERELARVRGVVEQYEQRIRSWDDQVALSTLTVELATRQPAIPAPGEPGFGSRASGAFADSIAALEEAGTSLVIFAIALAPWLPLLVPGFLLGRRWLRRRAGVPRAVVCPPPPPPAT